MSLVTQITDLVTRIATEFNTHSSRMGTLASLTTTDKTNLVAAINEVQGEVGSGGGDVAGDTHAATAKTTPVTADEFPLVDSAASWALKKITYGELATAIIAQISDSAPGTLDTLNELAAALGDDPNFATTITAALAARVRTDTAAQGLTGTQQTNARTNIAAAGSVEVGDTTHNFVTDFEAALA